MLASKAFTDVPRQGDDSELDDLTVAPRQRRNLWEAERERMLNGVVLFGLDGGRFGCPEEFL